MNIKRNYKKHPTLIGLDGSLWKESTRAWRDGDIENGHKITPISFFRLNFFYFGAVVILLVFLGRLFGLTIVAGQENRELAEGNRIKLIELEAERGKIFDRWGQEIARSRTVYTLVKGKEQREIDLAEAKKLEEGGHAGEFFEGDMGKIVRTVKREYPLSAAGAHVLGYTSTVQEEEKKKEPDIETINSRGRQGIEASYDRFLLGTAGKRLIEVDAQGRNVSILGEEEQKTGRNIHTTLDGELIKVSYEALKKYADEFGSRRGALVAQNPNTGEVLALVSYPSFDPTDIGRAVSDKNNPFFNRAVQGSYPPGSVFKITTSLAGLNSGVDKDWEVDDVGRFELGGEVFSNWYFNQYGKTEGLIKLERAIARSNDTYFYKLSERIGLDALRKTAIALGFGQKTGIDLPDEALGLVPDGVWKRSAIGDEWYLGDTMHLSIGQGYMLTSPIQVNGMTSYVASGKLTKPFIASRIEGGSDGGEISFDGKIEGETVASDENLNIVRAGMKRACETGGTGAPFFRAPYRVACKTGTAEEAGGKPHAWFTTYAPVEKPNIALTVVVERAGEGSQVAAPVAKEVMDWWFQNRINDERLKTND